jgi:hypothetical protein
MPVAQKSCRWEHGVLTSRTCEASRTLIRIEIEQLKTGVWGAGSRRWTVGHLFWGGKVERYQNPLNRLLSLLEEHERDSWFQHDGATTDDCFTTTVLWARCWAWPLATAISRLLSVGVLKQRVHWDKPRILDKRKCNSELSCQFLSSKGHHLVQCGTYIYIYTRMYNNGILTKCST